MINIYDDDEDEENDDDVAHASHVAKKREKAQSPTSAHLQPGQGITLGTSATTTAQSASLQLSKLKV